jgi:hypothetical protein
VTGHREQQYGPPPPYGPPPLPTTWPYGPDRPRTATTAAVLGFVTGGLTSMVSLFFLVVVALGDQNDPVAMVLILGLPCAAGLITGAARLMGGDVPAVLFFWAFAAMAVLALAEITAVVAFAGADALAVTVTVFVVLALPLPILTAVFAWHPDTRDWASEAG